MHAAGSRCGHLEMSTVKTCISKTHWPFSQLNYFPALKQSRTLKFLMTSSCSFIFFFPAIRAMSSSKPQRYSIWIGKKKSPVDSAEAINQMLKEQRYQFEMHTRNWDNGGYIVCCLIFYINIFLFPLTPNVSGFSFVQPFWFPLSNFNQVFKVDDNINEAWLMWEYLSGQKFYMGNHPGPTIETSGSIVLAERPADTSTRPKAAPETPRRPMTPERTGTSDFHISVWSFQILLYFTFFWVSLYFISLQYIH